ncbi:hypothetical protein C8J57DRAFT_1228601 [Mycena rebaudengoi]|nr:hypothetical protein C8J57DRAFT_1228601 [Mycena rebaudengoi]
MFRAAWVRSESSGLRVKGGRANRDFEVGWEEKETALVVGKGISHALASVETPAYDQLSSRKFTRRLRDNKPSSHNIETALNFPRREGSGSAFEHACFPPNAEPNLWSRFKHLLNLNAERASGSGSVQYLHVGEYVAVPPHYFWPPNQESNWRKEAGRRTVPVRLGVLLFREEGRKAHVAYPGGRVILPASILELGGRRKDTGFFLERFGDSDGPTDLDSHPWPVDDARSPPPRADTKRRRAGAEHAASDSGIGLDARGLRSAVCPRARSVRERAAGRLCAEPRDSEGVPGWRRAASDSGISLAAVVYARCGQAARARHGVQRGARRGRQKHGGGATSRTRAAITGSDSRARCVQSGGARSRAVTRGRCGARSTRFPQPHSRHHDAFPPRACVVSTGRRRGTTKDCRGTHLTRRDAAKVCRGGAVESDPQRARCAQGAVRLVMHPNTAKAFTTPADARKMRIHPAPHGPANPQTPFATPWQWDQTRKGNVLNVRERALEPWWCTGRVAARGWCARQLWTRGHRDDCDATTASIEI